VDLSREGRELADSIPILLWSPNPLPSRERVPEERGRRVRGLAEDAYVSVVPKSNTWLEAYQLLEDPSRAERAVFTVNTDRNSLRLARALSLSPW